jgi:hypothetical protein
MRKSRIILIAMAILTPVFIFGIYGTDLLSPKAEYIRLKNGTELHDVPVRKVDDYGYRIDGTYYTQFDIDSLAW